MKISRNLYTSTLYHMQANTQNDSAQDTQKEQKQEQEQQNTIDMFINEDGKWHKGTFYTSTKESPKHIIEHASLRRLACTRLVLYQMDTLIASLTAPFTTLPEPIKNLLRSSVSISTVLVFSYSKDLPAEDDLVLLAFVEFSNKNTEILLDLYHTTLREMNARSTCYIQEELPIQAAQKEHVVDIEAQVSDATVPVEVVKYKPDVVLDLDKTLLLSNVDGKKDQKDIVIGGYMAVTDDQFYHTLKLREGAHRFLRELSTFANVYVLTAADVHYARAAVGAANERKWTTDSPDDSKPQGDVPNVCIPITHVFSSRHSPKRALPKTFHRVLPFMPFLERQANTYGGTKRIFAVDDDITAWEPSCRDDVIVIPPCNPDHNDPSDLLSILDKIKQACA